MLILFYLKNYFFDIIYFYAKINVTVQLSTIPIFRDFKSLEILQSGFFELF